MNLPYEDWNGNVSCNSGNQACLAWVNWFTQVIGSPTIVDGLLDVTLSGPKF